LEGCSDVMLIAPCRGFTGAIWMLAIKSSCRKPHPKTVAYLETFHVSFVDWGEITKHDPFDHNHAPHNYRAWRLSFWAEGTQLVSLRFST